HRPFVKPEAVELAGSLCGAAQHELDQARQRGHLAVEGVGIDNEGSLVGPGRVPTEVCARIARRILEDDAGTGVPSRHERGLHAVVGEEEIPDGMLLATLTAGAMAGRQSVRASGVSGFALTPLITGESDHFARISPMARERYQGSTTAVSSRAECIDRIGAPTSTVRMPRRVAEIGPIVDPQGMVLFETNSCEGTPARWQAAFHAAAPCASVA